MDASNTIPKQTFREVVGAGGYFKAPNLRIYVRLVQPCFRGYMGACFPTEMRTIVTGLFPREGMDCFSCVVLIDSDPFYSSLKVKLLKLFKFLNF